MNITGTDWSKFSQNQRKKISPFGYRNVVNQHIPGYLLGQLGRNYAAQQPISGAQLLAIARVKVQQGNQLAAGRYFYLEADPVDQLTKFYRDNGFTYWQYSDGSFHQTPNKQVIFLQKLNR